MSYYFPSKLPLSHAQRVCRLYKEAVRSAQSWNPERHVWRYYAVLLRAEFDKHKDVKDFRKAKVLLEKAEEEVERRKHPQPLKFPLSPGGVAYARDPYFPDWMFDAWHPLEKAAYPEYFKLREKRKGEFIERWEKKYGKPDPSEMSH